MDSEPFKKFLAPYYDVAISKLTSVFRGADLNDHLSFIVGFICGSALTVASEETIIAEWRDGSQALGTFTSEEIRRVFDYVRLRLETGSATS